MDELPSTPILDRISKPADLRLLSSPELHALAEEIRQFLLVSVSRTGGHLGPNLGVVELTLALHRVFDSPRDRILWDTGHQAYVHKLLTRPREGFARLRKLGGMSGYPSRSESDHDFIENSHASTGLSYAAGMAEARRQTGDPGRVVVVVGDGALTGGMAYEALNNIGHRQTPVIIILNDNGRSYAPTIGGLARQLAQHLTVLNPTYHRTKGVVDRVLRRFPGGGTAMEAGRRMKEGLKELVSPRTVFEYMGLKYIGPLDGHKVDELQSYLRQAERLQYPVVVHVVTRKGRGYGPAEEDEIDHLHGVSAFDVVTAKPLGVRQPSYTDVFGEALVTEAEQEPRLNAITAAMGSSAGLGPFAARFPDRFYDVGIAEQHAVTFAAGLAMAGRRPVVAIYSTFLQRALDQVMMDVCLHRLSVVFVLDRAGITGEDGPSHHGIFDLTFLRAMPGLTLAAAADAQELRDLLHTAIAREGGGPFVIRFPRGTALEPGVQPARVLPPPSWEVLRQGGAALVLATGKMVAIAAEAAAILDHEGIRATVINARYIKPLDERLLSWAARHPVVVTVEDNVSTGGFGSAVAEALAGQGIPLTILAVPDSFVPHGSPTELLRQLGLDAQGVADQIRRASASSPIGEREALGQPGS